MLRDLIGRLNRDSDPHTTGLHVTYGRWGRRTVHHPDLAALLEARRARAIRQGLDPVDRALLDPATVALLRQTATRMAAEHPTTARAGPLARMPARS